MERTGALKMPDDVKIDEKNIVRHMHSTYKLR
jgi:hypothetical protein